MGCRCCVDIQTFQSCVASEKIKQDVNETPLQKKKKTFFKSFFFFVCLCHLHGSIAEAAGTHCKVCRRN